MPTSEPPLPPTEAVRAELAALLLLRRQRGKVRARRAMAAPLLDMNSLASTFTWRRPSPPQLLPSVQLLSCWSQLCNLTPIRR
jgi:hypothetical protein